MDSGITGRTARSEFKEALDQNKGSLEDAMTQLGLTAEQVAKYRAQIEESSDVIARNAKIHAESFTPIQRLKTAIGDLAFQHADAIKTAAGFAPVLIAAGPAAKGAQLGISALSGILPLLSSAWGIMGVAARVAWAAVLGPVGLVIAGIVAAVAVGVLIWKNWDTIKAKAIEVFGFIKDLFQSKWGWLLPGGILIKAILFFKDNWKAIWDSIVETTSKVWDTITGIVKGGLNIYISLFNKLIDIWNALEFKVPEVKVGPIKFGGWAVGTPNIPRIPSFQEGGIVPGALGSPQLIMAHGGERVTPVGRGGSDLHVHVTINGNVTGVDELEDVIVRAVRDGVRRGGFDGVLAPA